MHDLWTLCRRSTIYLVWPVCLTQFFYDCMSYRKSSEPKFHKLWNHSQVYTCMFSSYTSVHHNIYMPTITSADLSIGLLPSESAIEFTDTLFFTGPSEYIKNEIPNKVMSTFKVEKLLKMNCITYFSYTFIYLSVISSYFIASPTM